MLEELQLKIRKHPEECCHMIRDGQRIERGGND